jgi:hypothetical protein
MMRRSLKRKQRRASSDGDTAKEPLNLILAQERAETGWIICAPQGHYGVPSSGVVTRTGLSSAGVHLSRFIALMEC